MDDKRISPSESVEWNELIEVSKKFSNVNKVKLKYETLLNELTLFQNLIDLGKGVEDKILTSLFSFTIQVISDPDESDFVSGESLIIVVQNISEIFSFNREFWYLTLDVNRGSSVSVWRFEKEFFRPGDSDKFVIKFIPNLDRLVPTPAQEIRINLILSIVFNEKQFQRIFEGTKIYVDALHLLSPGKRHPYGQYKNFISGNFEVGIEDADSTSTPLFPPIIKFQIRLNDSSIAKFPGLFLSDSIHRGFGNLSDFENLKEFTVFFESDKIVVTIQENVGWTVHCSTNSKLLCAIKVSVFRRLLAFPDLTIESPEEEHCEKLSKLSLKLQSSSGEVDSAGFQEMYLLLRDVSEQIQFSIL